MSMSSTRNRYHKIASGVLTSTRSNSAVTALLDAAEAGHDQKVKQLIKKYRTLIDLKCNTTGDTALITAARNGHSNIVEYLLECGADPTLQNDSGETALKVAKPHIKESILSSISDEDRPSTAHQLLQSAWFGDALSVKKTLSGNVIDVNCCNSEGLTPLLLVTRDVGTFEKVQHVMKTEYNPLQVMKELLKHNAHVSSSDRHGQTALHLTASTEGGGVQAKKVVSLLLKNGGDANSLDHNDYSPLHTAAKAGHTAIIVALVEEGNADINIKGGDRGKTPLMLSAHEGHKETAQYLLSKGADVTVVDEFGDTALTVAKTPSMISLMKEAWNDQTSSRKAADSPSTPGKPCEESDDDDEEALTEHINDTIPFFVTQHNTSGQSTNDMTRLESVDASDSSANTPEPTFFSEAEADDEREENGTSKRSKPATKRSQVRSSMQETLTCNRLLRDTKKIPFTKKPIGMKGLSLDEERSSSQHLLRQQSQKLRRSSLLLSRSLESLPLSGCSTPCTPMVTTPTANTPTHSKRMSLPSVTQTALISAAINIPNLPCNSQPVALFAIDAEQEKLQVQEFSRGGSKLSRTARSLPNIKSSMPHVYLSDSKSNVTSKVSFLPSVVTPHLTPHPPPSHSHRHAPSRSRLPRLSQTIPTGIGLVVASLSVVNEDIESMSSDKTLTPEEDKLIAPDGTLSFSSSSNTVINYAVKRREEEPPLSPIWNNMQYLHTDGADTTSCGEYITSYVGSRTPFPRHLLLPECLPARKVPATDSGHEGESDDGELSSSSSSEEVDEGEEEREELKWKKGKLLGRGAFGKVYEGLMDSAKLIAVKEVELDVETNEKAKVQFDKIHLEVDILRSLSHRNIVSYLGAAMDKTIVYIFMEYISGGSLQSILKRFGALDERTICHYTRQITRGIVYLHQNGVIHRDIKGANIMVTSKGVVKLIDFGCAKRYCQDLSMGFHSVRGTPYWMAPEVICGRGYGRKSDVWSLGCTIYEMIMARPPWGDLPPEAAMFQIGIGQTIPQLPDHLSFELRQLFSLCLSRDPVNRFTSQDVLEHAFICNVSRTKVVRRK